MARIGDLCRIQAGYAARSRVEPAFAGGVLAIQLQDISRRGVIDPQRLCRARIELPDDRYLVKQGDVLFRSRGEAPTACGVPSNLDEPAVAIQPLVILRPDRGAVLPDFLVWAINQPDAQRRLRAGSQGTNLRMIPVAVLKDLEIAVPDLPTQKRIVALNALARQEGELFRRLAARREDLVTAILGEAAKAADQKEIAR